MAQKLMAITKAELIAKLTSSGLDDAQVFEAIRFDDVTDLVKCLYQGTSVDLSSEALLFAEDLLATATSRANLARRLEDDGLPGGLSDSLWLARAAKAKARATASSEAAAIPLGVGASAARR